MHSYKITSVTEGVSSFGNLESMKDIANPIITSVVPNKMNAAPGDIITLIATVTDDTVLDYLQVQVNGEYLTREGLQTKNYKVSPTRGEPRTVTINYSIPSKGKTKDCVFFFILADVTGKTDNKEITVSVSKDGGGGGVSPTCGSGGHNAPCTTDNDCASCSCTGRNKCAK